MKIIEKNASMLCIIALIGYTVFMLAFSWFGPVFYAEIDSNTLPVISLQYRGSVTANSSDLIHAKEDFPNLYADVNSYDDLRSAKLQITKDGEWLPYYFPIYPLLCIPMKIVLSILELNQERTFFITNTLLLSGALWFLYLKWKVTYIQKLVAILMLAISPIIYYNNYINYEVFIFSMLIIGMVSYYNGNRKVSAVSVSLAAMPNSAVAAIGLVMIAEYLVKIICYIKQQSISLAVRQYGRETALYALCFTPCLIPFAVQKHYLQHDTFSAMAQTNHLIERFLTYIFDPTLGFTLFAPISLVLCLLTLIFSVIHKRYQAVWFFAMFVAVILAFSLMPHINCAVIFCARYVAWSYALIPIFIVAYGVDTLKRKYTEVLLSGLAIGSSFILLVWNGPTLTHSYEYTPLAQVVMKVMPSIYNQYSATFYCRTLHIDGAYDVKEPAYYTDEDTGQIYKLIYKADNGQIERVLSEVTGDEDTISYLTKQLMKNEIDGDFHYVNFPIWGKYRLYQNSDVTENTAAQW